jgi:lysyl-tRNA synthetase class 2
MLTSPVMDHPTDDWRPTASLDALRVRADTLATLRAFFADRGLLEIETPLLSAATVTDLHLHSLALTVGVDDGQTMYLQTSPEFAMKRLLAGGCGPIYQISRAFRGAEAGRRHNPEFTLLEWYRPGWDHHRLMDEIDELLAAVLGTQPGERLTYAQAFERHAGVDPHGARQTELERRVRDLGVQGVTDLERDDLLNLLLTHIVEPNLGRGRPTFIHDYPASQAALSRIRPGEPPLAERFEVFVAGVELANGYHELADPAEQRHRFEADLSERSRRGLPEVPIDHRLLAALEAGLPDCAGVALGVDRLVMLKAGTDDISDVIAFPIDRA